MKSILSRGSSAWLPKKVLVHSSAAFVLILLLLAMAFGDARHVMLVVFSLPSTMIGGVAAVALTGTALTLGSMVGFVALFPVALQLHQAGHEIEGPMAIVILGGLVSSTLVSLLLIPPLASRWLRGGGAREQ